MAGAQGRMKAAIAALALCALALSACHGHPRTTQTAEPADHSTPSGLPVPRYISLKFGSVNVRAGPSDDHRLLRVYHVRGLPVQVIAETEDWRRVCDPDGQVGWVHRRTTDGRRTVMRTQAGPAPILSAPNSGARVVAYLASRGLASLDRCQDGWCKITVGSVKGWSEASALWGTADAPQCR